MILTCPECASRYQVDDASVPPQGRTVRCAACSASWRALPTDADEPPPLELTPEPAATEAEPAKPAAAALPKKIRAAHDARRRTRHAVAAGAVWGVLGAMLVAVIGGAILFRVDVVRLWPRTAGAFAKVGLPVNPTGLAPENIIAGPGLKDGHAAVIVSGVIRNVETRSHDPAPLRIALLDKAGHPLVSQVIRLPEGKLRPGETRPFSTAFLDPPSASADIQVEFALDLIAPQAGMQKTAAVREPRLRGLAEPTLPPAPKPQPAQALPADSPYALPSSAQDNTQRPHEG